MALATELVAALRTLNADESVRALVLTGADGHFCSGGDMKGMSEGAARTVEQRHAGMAPYRELCETLAGLDKPLIAAVDGVAYGAGLSLSLYGDIVLASSRARLSMAFQRVGMVPDLGAWYNLPRLVGLQRARELIYSAREFGGEEAQRIGLVLEVLAPEALLPRALELAHGLEGASALALRLSKQALAISLNSDLRTMLDLEASAQAIAGASGYVRESVRRFAAREPAQFQWPQKKESE